MTFCAREGKDEFVFTANGTCAADEGAERIRITVADSSLKVVKGSDAFGRRTP